MLGANRLITQARVSFTQPLPLALMPRIEAIPGVARVAHSQFFGGIYQDERNFFPQFAVDPERLLDSYPEWKLDPAQREAFVRTKTGAIVGRKLADKFGFKIGDKLPLRSFIFTRKDGTRAWEWDIVGIFDGQDADWDNRSNLAYLNFGHFDEARQFGSGSAGVYIVRVDNPEKTSQLTQEFQLNGKTTHCGIDVFSLVKSDGGWKIAGLMWTQEPGACAELKSRKQGVR